MERKEAGQTQDKRVDEDWKEAIEREKSRAKVESPPPQANFIFFISNLGMQALMFMGEVESPVSKKIEKDLSQARYIIDIIDMLKEKTKGNLTEEEANIIDNTLYELRMKYVAIAK